MMVVAPAYQTTLFAGGSVHVGSLAALERTWLDPVCWVDICRGWLGGADQLYEELVHTLPWHQGRRPMYGGLVDEPRLSAGVPLDRDAAAAAVVDVRDALAGYYCRDFDGAWANYYRTGADSVAWHGDRVGRHEADPVVAVVSLGGPRRFLLRPNGGGGSRCFELHSGDLLVMGGRCQTRFEHAVPKMARAQPRISVSYRHGWRRMAGKAWAPGRTVRPTPAG